MSGWIQTSDSRGAFYGLKKFCLLQMAFLETFSQCWRGLFVSDVRKHPRAVLDLIARVQIGIVGSAILPHAVDDTEPSLA
jgi:hypothetical protein